MMTYWDGTGKFQAAYEELNKLIPVEGPCPDARGRNRKLDKMRRAANCYYDLFNNGLCNLAREFRREFGFGGKVIADVYYYSDCELLRRLEAKMDQIIYDAAVEQQLFQYLPTEERC